MTIQTWQERNSERANSQAFFTPADMQAEIDELRAELEKLKQQEPVAHLKIWGEDQVKDSQECPVYLAAGAQPVPEGYQLAPITHGSRMYGAGSNALYEHAQMLKSMGRSTDMIHTSDEALCRKIYKAMLEAAKDTK